MDVLAGTDFFTVEVLTWRGLVTYYVLFSLHLESRRVSIAGIPDIRMKSGCHRSPAAPPRKLGAIFIPAATFSTIMTPSSVLRFGRY